MIEPNLKVSEFIGPLDPTSREDAWFKTVNLDFDDLEEMGQTPAEDNCLRDLEVFGDRKVLINRWNSDVATLRKALRQVTTREELYSCVDFGAMIDSAMNMDPTWYRPFDSYARLEREFEWVEQRITARERAITSEKARLDAYARSVYVHSFNNKEVRVTA